MGWEEAKNMSHSSLSNKVYMEWEEKEEIYVMLHFVTCDKHFLFGLLGPPTLDALRFEQYSITNIFRK